MQWMVFKRLLAVQLLLALPACTTPGAAEFEVYRNSFETAFGSGQSILDRVAVKERETFGLSQPQIAPNNVSFDPTNAEYFVEGVDPPGTASLRKTFRIIKVYNDTMSGLASGAAAQALASQVTEISSTAVSLGLQLTTPLSTPQAKITETLAEKTQPLRALEPLSVVVFGQVTRQEFRDQMLAQSGTVDALLVELIEFSGNSGRPDPRSGGQSTSQNCASASASPSMFCLMTAPSRLATKSVSGTRSFTAAEVEEIENTRALLANWVVLLNTTRASLNSTVEAVREGSTSGAAILASASELEVAARGVRAALAE